MFYQEVFAYSDLKAIRFYAMHDFWGGMMPAVPQEKINTLREHTGALLMHLRLKGFDKHRFDLFNMPDGIPDSAEGNKLRSIIA